MLFRRHSSYHYICFPKCSCVTALFFVISLLRGSAESVKHWLCAPSAVLKSYVAINAFAAVVVAVAVRAVAVGAGDVFSSSAVAAGVLDFAPICEDDVAMVTLSQR